MSTKAIYYVGVLFLLFGTLLGGGLDKLNLFPYLWVVPIRLIVFISICFYLQGNKAFLHKLAKFLLPISIFIDHLISGVPYLLSAPSVFGWFAVFAGELAILLILPLSKEKLKRNYLFGMFFVSILGFLLAFLVRFIIAFA